uniref:Excision repair cross-complementation group 6-like 2 n=1 Tax=Neogobius melanostomus TaxID=47308 RepID=A0A8C6TWD7_9GOBI
MYLTISALQARSLKWDEGDTCLAPDPKDGILREATIRRLSSSSEHPPSTAWLIFKDHGTDGVEESVPVSKLKEPKDKMSFTQEKPFFPATVVNSNGCVPFELSCEDKVPYTINRYLRDYQREGIKFMYSNYIRSKGCILGDDMGLGKTVQVIGFLAALLHKKGTWEDIDSNRPSFLQSQACDKQSNPNKVFLIVAPLSVLYNWKDELETWGHFQVVVVHGLRKEEELNRIKKGRIEIALTTYETLRLCLDLFDHINWSAVIVDEAHKIKNPHSLITQAMKELRCQIRIGLTGTILQNNLEELWCVMDWAVPKCLGSLGHFKTKFAEPIEQGQRHSATKRALATGRKIVRALVKKISYSFLRRTKALIKEQLPKKDDRVVYCSLTDFQQTVYETVLKSEDVTLLLRSSEKCDCGSGHTRRRCCYDTNSEGVAMKKLYFTYLAILRKVANHVALLQSSPGTSKNQYLGIICQKVFQQFPDFVQRCKHEAFEALSDPMYSGKMKVLQKLLNYYLQRKDKVLLFSLSTKLLDVLESYCMAEGLDYSRLDGNTKSKERVQIVKEFNSSSHINICLVSTMAGGLGLNFVGANVVVLFDPTWNPANDLQAIDRAYRIGQCRDVTVLRLISLGTVEEVIYLRQVYKQQLHSSVVAVENARRYFEAVQGVDAQKGELFGMKNLFRLQTRGSCLTRQILEREGQVEAGLTTTRTHATEEKEEEHSASKSSVAPADNRDGAKLPRGVLDFSSGSEDDEDGITKKLADPNTTEGTTSTPGRMTLLQQGFSKLLQRLKGTLDLVDGGSSDIDESSSDEAGQQEETSRSSPNVSIFNTVKDSAKLNNELKILSDSDESDVSRKKEYSSSKVKKAFVRRPNIFNCSSDESEDLDIEVMTSSHKKAVVLPPKKTGEKKNRKRPMSIKSKVKFTGNIESFTSSEDERKSKKPRPKGSPVKERIWVKPNWRKCTRLMWGLRSYDMASVFKGGVQEVAYTHSNQRVVGGSRAEELISRAAVRDVFQRHMFSQMPANHLMGTQELQRPSLEHPVSFTTRSTHQTRHTTFIIGETPRSTCRQQLEEMSATFHFPSVEQFAKEVLKSTSNQRLSWLRQYYTSTDHPDLADTVSKHFPQLLPVKTAPSTSSNAPPSSAAPCDEASKTIVKVSPCKKRSKRSKCQDVKDKKQKRDPFAEIPSPETKRSFALHATRSKDRDEDGLDLSRLDATVLTNKHSDGNPDFSVALAEQQTLSKNSQEPKGNLESLTSTKENPKSFLTDLIGDTSILSDLFKPKRTSPKIPISPPKTPIKKSSKDFWDVLQEGDEESLNRLTDPAEVQRVCVNTHIAAREHYKQEENKSLWKTNEKFLWRK